MKDITYIISEVSKRTGVDEKIVEGIIRSAANDCRNFMDEKQGFCIYFPRLGTFKYQVTAIKEYILRQQRFLAFWYIRLKMGLESNNLRTIEAAEINIDLYKEKIRKTLLIKQDFIRYHAQYYAFANRLVSKDTLSDIGRLDELYDVSHLIKNYKKRGKKSKGDMPELSEEGLLPAPDKEESGN